MSFCAKCGSEIAPGSTFCESCGAPAPGAGAAPNQAAASATPPAAAPIPPQAAASPPPPPGMAPTPPPLMAGAPAYGPPGPPAGPAYQPPKSGGGGKAALFGLLGLLVIGIVVVLLLGFAVGPKWFVGSSNGPEQTVDTFLKAMENKDIKLLMSVFSPESLQTLQDLMGSYYDDIETFFSDVVFSNYQSIKFDGVKYSTTINGDKATVKVVEGKLTMVDSDGVRTTGDMKDSDTSTVYQLVKENGKWYIDYESM